MRRALLTLAVAMALCPGVRADNDWDDALYGGLMGAAIGAIVGHNSDMSSEVAIPLFAGLGALAGYSYDSDRGSSRGRYYGSDDNRGYSDPGYRYQSFPYSYRPHLYAPTAYRHHAKPAKVKKPTPAELTRPHNLTPGVELVSVPLSLPSGTSFALRLVKLPDRYIGPQGETYAELPSAEVLAARYQPKP